MTLSKMIKQNAKHALKGNWNRAVTVVTIFCVLALTLVGLQQYATDILLGVPGSAGRIAQDISRLIPDFETILLIAFFALTAFLVFPLEMGLLRWFFRLTHSEKPPVSEAFIFFEGARKYFKSIFLYISVSVRMLLWSALFFAVPSAVLWLSILLTNGAVSLGGVTPEAGSSLGTLGIALAVLFFFLAAFLLLIHLNRYALAFYLFFDDTDINLLSAIRDSVKFTKSYRAGLFFFQLSFLGWLLLCLFIIPVLYVLPYYNTASSMYARYIIEKRRASTMAFASAAEPTHEFPIRAALPDETVREEDNLPQ